MKKIYLVLGAALSGKGTQSKKLSNEFGFIHISTGDLIRSEVDKKTPLGEEIAQTISNGDLVADSIINRLLSDRLSEYNEGSFILDGYPRTYSQLVYLKSKDNISIKNVLFLNVETDILLNRAKSRYIEQNREDDKNVTSVLNRIEIFERQTKPILKYFDEESVVNVNGDKAPDEVFKTIKENLTV